MLKYGFLVADCRLARIPEARMIKSLKTWLKQRFSDADPPPAASLRSTGSYRQRLAENGKPSLEAKSPAGEQKVDVDPHIHGTVESLGPGKNVYVQSPYVREDLGTHESLKIIDDSLLDDEEPAGIDPYNTGRFDKSRKWDQRFRK